MKHHNALESDINVVESTNNKKKKNKGKTVGVTLVPEELELLGARLQRDGFETLAHMVRAYIKGSFPKQQTNVEITNFIQKLRKRDIKDPVTGEISLHFYKNVDMKAFKIYCENRYKD